MSGQRRVLIVEARFYDQIADELAEGAIAVLENAGISHDRIEVPGVFELPAAIGYAARSTSGPSYDGFIALGCVIRGETDHYDHICRESSRALMNLAMDDAIAFGFGVLTCENGDQARVRSNPAGDKNVGGKAAEACLRMIDLKTRYRPSTR